MPSPSLNLNKDDEWYTPKYIVEYFGKFDYDPATTDAKAKEFGITNYDTIQTDGLKSDWCKYNRIWINPPFTHKREFLVKAWDTFSQTHNEIYVLLPIAFLTTKSFYSVIKGGVLHLPNGRFSFEKASGTPATSPALGTFVLKLDDKWSVQLLNLESIKPRKGEEKCKQKSTSQMRLWN